MAAVSATSRWSTSSRRSIIPARRSPTGRRWTTLRCLERRQVRARPGPSIRARCRSRSPRRRCTWRRCAGWRSSCFAPKASRLPRTGHREARDAGRAASGGTVRETDRPRGGAGRRARPLCQVMGLARPLWRRRAEAAAAEGSPRLVRGGELVHARGPAARFMHCLPVRRNVVVGTRCWTDHAASSCAKPSNRMWTQMAVLYRLLKGERHDKVHVRPADRRSGGAVKRRGPLYPPVQGQACSWSRRAAVCSASAHAAARCLEQVDLLHQVGIRVVLVHGGGSQLDATSPAPSERSRASSKAGA